MRLDDLSCEELRQEVAAALLGPDGRDCPVISRVSWLRSLVDAARNRSVKEAIDNLEVNPDSRDFSSVTEMVDECTILLEALERLVHIEAAPVERSAVPATTDLDLIPF